MTRAMTRARSAVQIPSRLRKWILSVSAAILMTLELIAYPKDIITAPDQYIYQVPFQDILAGFVHPTQGNYPAWLLVAIAALILSITVQGIVRHGTRITYRILTALGLLFALWGLLSGGLPAWTPVGRLDGFGWLFQTAAVLLAAAAVWGWAVTNSERARLLVQGTDRVWKLVTNSRQGKVGLIVIVTFISGALLAPFIAAHYYLKGDAIIGLPFEGPSWSFYGLLGTDDQGLSLLTQFIWSARISLSVGLMAAALSAVLGTLVGLFAGFYGKWTDEGLMRTTDAFLCIPWLPLAVILAAVLGTNYGIIMLIIGITCWPTTARLVRSETLRVRELQFVERAHAIGSSNGHIMSKHVLPNVLPLAFANTVLVVAIAILSETTLTFLGLGDALNFSWGSMLRSAWVSGAAGLPDWWYLLPPGIAIALVVLAFTFVSRSFDQVLDPKLRKREESDGSSGRQVDEGAPPPAAAGDRRDSS